MNVVDLNLDEELELGDLDPAARSRSAMPPPTLTQFVAWLVELLEAKQLDDVEAIRATIRTAYAVVRPHLWSPGDVADACVYLAATGQLPAGVDASAVYRVTREELTR